MRDTLAACPLAAPHATNGRPATAGFGLFGSPHDEEISMIRRHRSAIASTVLFFLALAAAGCAQQGAEELVIGEYGSLTGNDATFGTSTKEGVEIALDEIKAKDGKIGGLTVKVVVEDDRGQAEEAATVVQKLINQDQVVAVLGEVASSRSLAAGPICQQAGVPMISPSSTNPRVTEVGDYIFRVCFLDDFQGRVMARFTAENLGLRQVAILKDVKSDYSVGLAQYYSEALQSMGGQIVVEQSFSAGDQDFRAQLTAIKAKSPQAIFLPIYYTEAGLIARQARELGITVPLLGSDGWESQQLLEIGGEALNNSYYSNHWALDAPHPALQAFLERFQQKYNKEPDAIAGLAYDAARILFGTMQSMSEEDAATFAGLSSKNAGSEARKAATLALRDRLAATKGFTGVTGSITIDENRNASKPAVVIEVKGGKKVMNTSIAP
jgi:branched-chain amino acid transport system substrate-binding protein